MPNAPANSAPNSPASGDAPPARQDLALLPDNPAAVEVILYPDPRLRRRSIPIEQFDAETVEKLRGLTTRMFELMRQHRGVGLAAPQVGVNVRLFVMNATGEPGDDRVYVNPELSCPEGEEASEEGCLSLPEINTDVWRSLTLRMQARDVEGNEIDETAEGFLPRVWQHEVDHLDGVLILDKMPPTAKMASRKKLKELEEDYRKAHPELAKPAAKKKRLFGRRR